jgi:hypothetical protein
MASGEIEITPGRVLSSDELITAQKLNDLGAPTLRIKELTITARELADGSINSDKLDVDLEAQLGIPDNSITTAKLVDSAVTTSKIVAEVSMRTVAGATYRPAGVLFSKPDKVDSAGTAEQTAWTYNMPAGLMGHDGDTLRLTTLFVANTAVAGSKICRLRFDGVAITLVSSTTTSTTWFFCTAMIYRRSASTQIALNTQINNVAGQDVAQTVLSSNLTLAIPILVSIQSPSGAGATVQLSASTLEFLPAP